MPSQVKIISDASLNPSNVIIVDDMCLFQPGCQFFCELSYDSQTTEFEENNQKNNCDAAVSERKDEFQIFNSWTIMEPIFLCTCVGFRFDTCGSLVKVVEAVRTFAPEAGCSAACSGFTCFMHCETTQDDKDENSNYSNSLC